MSVEGMREERKVVTVLFADVVGSTELTERLDPEDARDLLGGALRTMIEAVERFGGTVKDLAGDGVLALFGAPVTHEDDPERAVRAGLEIVRAVAAVGKAASLSVRVGIESGLVVLGPVGAGGRVEYGATGDALNVAARLQAHAPPGGVLVGAVTQGAVAGRFAWGRERRLELKGKAEPVTAFEVLDARDREARRRDAEGDEVPLIGRDEELARAVALARRALDGGGGLVLVAGEPGIGKSRLVEEVRRSVSGDVRWLEGRCVSFGQSTPFLPLRDGILDALQIRPDAPNPAAALREGLRAVVGEAAEDAAPYLEAILGVGAEAPSVSAETLHFRTLETLRVLLRRLAERGPLAVVVEDVHWADPSTLHVLERLLPATSGAPVLFVLTVRDHEAASGWLARVRSAMPEDARELIELRPLAPESEGDLLSALAGDRELPEDLRRRVVDTAGGNPFFLGELVRSMRATPTAPGELPATVEKVILARLDVLEPEPRDVLTAASVLGRTAPTALLERLVQADPGPAVNELRRLDLLERASRPDELVFRHALIQEVAYGTLLKRRRRELHARAAAAIGELWPDRLDEQLALLAYHHRGAGELDEARACHARAAERAERLHATDEALEHLTSAIALAEELARPASDRDVAELLLARARVRARTGDARGATEDLERVLAAGAETDVQMRAHDELGFLLAGAADYRAAVPHLEAALEAAVAVDDVPAQVSALSRLALVHANRLDFEAGHEQATRALALAEAASDERAEAVAMDALKQVAVETGDFVALDRVGERLAELHRRHDDLWYLQFVLFESGIADVARARLDRAFERIEEALAVNARIGDRGNAPLLLAGLGAAHRARGEYGRAVEVGRRALAAAGRLDHAEWIAWSGVELGATLLELGAFEEAGRALEVGTEAAERSAADMHTLRCRALDALAAWSGGDRERAAEQADAAQAILDRVRLPPGRAFMLGRDAYLGLARVRTAQGAIEVARSLLATIVRACEASGASDGTVDGRLALAELALREGDVAAALAEADRALAEALRVGLPTAWRTHAALADARRAAGDLERAADHARRARAQVAQLAGTIDDDAIREAFRANAAERLSATGGATGG